MSELMHLIPLLFALFSCTEACMPTLSDSEDCDIRRLSPAFLVGGEVDVACTGTEGEASEWELSPFLDRLQIAAGGGTLDGQPVRETIDSGGPNAVRAY